MTKLRISCDLPGFTTLAEDDVCLGQEQRDRGNKLREELIVEMEGLRPRSVSLSPTSPILDSLKIIRCWDEVGEIFRSDDDTVAAAAHLEGKAVFK